jgi:DNA-binding SARP family transcriptional activator
MMSHLTLHIFGSPEIHIDDNPLAIKERKALALLVYLAVCGAAQQRETLVTLLWPEHEPKRGRSNLRHVLWVLKQAIGEGWLETEGEHIALRQSADVWTDVASFKTLLADKGASSSSSPSLEQLEQAVALYRGDFLAGFTLPGCPAFDEWQFFEAETTPRGHDRRFG